MRRIDLSGERFGKLLVVEVDKYENECLYYKCLCECGNTTIVCRKNLKNGNVKSCGCLLRTRGGWSNGENKATYKAWKEMIGRCYNEKYENYPIYGGRGITVCDRWLDKVNGFINFVADMGVRPSTNHSLDRYPNNATGNYEPTNCRWGTKEEQERNKRTNRFLEYNGEKKIIQDWATYFGVTRNEIYKMLSNGVFSDVR